MAQEAHLGREPDRSALERWAPPLAGALVAVVALSLLVVALNGRDDDGLRAAALGPLAPALLAAVLALAAWRRADRRAAAAREGAAAELERRDAAHVAERERLREESRERGLALARQRELAARLEHSRRIEREWSRELRDQLARAGAKEGSPARGDDVRGLVLRAAISLCEAEKGLLLARDDGDGDGDLDLAVSQGFVHDPEGSAVAQRFAREVLARDQIVREDDLGDDMRRTPADDEIETLVAVPVYLRDRFHGVVVCANRRGGFEELDDDLLLALGDHAGSALQGERLRAALGEAHRAAVRALAELLAAGDPARHQEAGELAAPADGLARELGLDAREREVLLGAVLLRDLGLVALPEGLLAHPGPLSADQRAAVELHPRIAFNVLHQIPALNDVATVVLYHHERVDGRGYPAGLAGEAIPRLARALAVLDAYGALVHERPHRPARSPAEAIAELVSAAGSQLDPEITQLFVEHLRRGALAPAAPAPLDGDGARALVEELATPSTDALTLLGSHRSLQEAVQRAAAEAGSDEPFVVAIVQLEDLRRVNEQAGYAAGDRLIQLAARNLQRVAGRLGGSAHRESGRRLGLVAAAPEELVAQQIETEFSAGPAIRLGIAPGRGGARGEELVARARQALRPPVGAVRSQG
jgi:HD-GYP domain-containing protein (c-di-GMP phosphodiesterase class II)